MAKNRNQSAGPLFLGIEGGGTRTVAILADARGKLVKRIEAGPGNARLLDDVKLRELLGSIAAKLPAPDAVGIGMAGVRTASDKRRVQQAVEKVWGAIPCRVTNDLETALSADEGNRVKGRVRVLVLSGTGSCCFGRDARGRTAKIGGWGHILGDRGSGYQIGLLALRAVVSAADTSGKWPVWGRKILRKLHLKQPHELIDWVQSAQKAEIAALAEEVFQAADQGDKMAAIVLELENDRLSRDATDCAGKLAKRGTPVEFVLAGGILLNQPKFASQLAERLRNLWPRAVVAKLRREGAWGAVAMAQEIWHSKGRPKKSKPHARAAQAPAFDWAKLPSTEQRNPRSSNLDRMPLEEAIELMASEDAKIPAAILEWRAEIAKAVRMIASAFKRGGRLFYVGAGTSGRLGVLDASECPPTFRTPPEMVQGIMAGGAAALVRSVEGAEDDAGAGVEAIGERRVNARDLVLGISASGRAPFVWGALDEAARCGAKTILLCFNPFKPVAGHRRPALVIAPQVGPEVLTGSTRLKAGTATKLILNMLTTLAMARTGRVAGNLMVDLNPSNAKLRARAVRIVRELCGADGARARRALERNGWVVQRACAKLGS